jgi:alcohol dehydrogenase/L-iditol 2-dehydrogenase
MSQLAVVNYGPKPHSVELREVEEPQPGPDDVILEVQAVGVCGSDLHMWTGQQSWKVEYPMVLGHEFAGIIRQVGDKVRDWQVGQRVVSETHARIDANSPLSRQGLYNLDPNRGGFGAAVSGAMTRRIRVPTRILHRLPHALTFEKAALTEPCCVAYNAAVMNARIHPGDRILVLGPGPIGILSAAMARLCGAEVAVLGLPRDQQRLEVTRLYRRMDLESRLGAAAPELFARPARAKKHPPARELQPQLADLGTRDPPAGHGTIECGADHRRPVAPECMARGV